jgi:tRNA nucleotidyltransferase (CCA-adding enzyme)
MPKFSAIVVFPTPPFSEATVRVTVMDFRPTIRRAVSAYLIITVGLMSGKWMKAILDEVLRRVRPTKADRARMEGVAVELTERVRRAGTKLGVRVKPVVLGSAARGTWLRSERDVDVFLLFPENLPREELERRGLAVAREVAGRRGKERFAEHPYLTFELRGFRVDLVPCYEVADPRKLKSAVDRTPHHQRYVQRRLTPGLADQVLLLKKFTQGIGVYGAELRVQGFSGYLCELLILHYGSFQKLVEAARGWEPGVVVDLEGSYPNETEPKVLFERHPLIVVDPVDPNRNVAAAVSMQNFSTFVQACREFHRGPRLEFFFPRPPRLIEPGELRRVLRRRGTKLYCLVFSHPDLSEDVIYPQLRKTERALVARLVQAGFEVLRSDVWADRRSAAVLLELTISRLPRVQTRPGPVTTLDASDFIREHFRSRRRMAGPFIDRAGRVVFELERAELDASVALRRAVDERLGFGRHVAEAVGRKYRILEGGEIASFFRNRGFRRFISEYLARCLPWYR